MKTYYVLVKVLTRPHPGRPGDGVALEGLHATKAAAEAVAAKRPPTDSNTYQICRVIGDWRRLTNGGPVWLYGGHTTRARARVR